MLIVKKKGNPVIHDNTDESGGHYAKWDIAGTENPELYRFSQL